MKKTSPHKLYEMSLDNHGHCDRDKYIDLMVKEGWITRKVKKDEQVEYHHQRREQQAKEFNNPCTCLTPMLNNEKCPIHGLLKRHC